MEDTARSSKRKLENSFLRSWDDVSVNGVYLVRGKSQNMKFQFIHCLITVSPSNLHQSNLVCPISYVFALLPSQFVRKGSLSVLVYSIDILHKFNDRTEIVATQQFNYCPRMRRYSWCSTGISIMYCPCVWANCGTWKSSFRSHMFSLPISSDGNAENK